VRRYVLTNEIAELSHEYSSILTDRLIDCLLIIMDVEKLIESVRKRPILFECTTKAYKDAAKKEDAWTVR